ncbi:MAG TPA: hypothetical protein VGR37_00120, partial [Longimicrobiaceae bacterium]|nr:hypothetical protein [Longimicrobiaceae bacterium]
MVPALLFAVATLASTAAPAQRAPAWTVESGARGVAVAPATGRGYAALPLSALVSVGAEVAPRGDEVEVRLAGRELRFRAGSP